MKTRTALKTTALLATSFASPLIEQQPLFADDRSDLIRVLRKAEIIPTVLDTFKPYLSVSASWKQASAEVGNSIDPKRVREAPAVQFLDILPGFTSLWTDKEHPQLTLALTDPDARSREKPDWSEMCHWIATDISLSSISNATAPSNYTEIVTFKPLGPPKKTGKHRYVFAALAPTDGTYEKLNLTTPADRQHWGYGEARTGLRKWAKENGLTVVRISSMLSIRSNNQP